VRRVGDWGLIERTGERATLYSRSHIEETFPRPLGPLAWSLVEGPLERAQRRVFHSHLGLLSSKECDSERFMAMFDRYVYRNVTLLQHAVARFPGGARHAVDPSSSLGVDIADVPRRRVAATDPLWWVWSVPASTRAALRLPRLLEADERCVGAASRVSASTRSLDDRIDALNSLQDALTQAWTTHYLARSVSLAAARVASILLRNGEGGCSLPAVDGLRGIELASAQAVEGVMAAARARANGEDVRWLAGELVARAGHRGRNELDPTEEVDGERLRHFMQVIEAIAAESELVVVERVLRTVPFVERVAAGLLAMVETSKANVAAVVDAMRSVCRELEVPGLELSTVSLVSLPEFNDRRFPSHVELERRRAELSVAGSTAPPPALFQVGSELRRASREDSRVTDVLRGVGRFEGRIVGRAWVPTSFEEVRDGDILVLEAVDPMTAAWLPGSRAVITDEGGLLSHGMLLARHYGVPAIVGTRQATSSIRTGDIVCLEGSESVVRILSRAEHSVDEVGFAMAGEDKRGAHRHDLGE